MDAFLSVLLPQESEHESLDEKKKEVKKKRKFSMVAMKKIQARAAEEARQQIIRQKQEFLKETKTRVLAEWEMNHEKAPVFQQEFVDRQILFQISAEKFGEIKKTWDEYLVERRKHEEWLQYLKCDGLPDMSSPSEINSYIFVWTELENNFQMSHCIQKTEEVMKLLSNLEKVILDPGPDRPPNYLRDLKELRNEIRDLLQAHIDKATFYLFSRIKSDMVSITVTTSKYFATCPFFQMNLWAEMIMPIPSTGKDIRKLLKITFEEIQVTITLPIALMDIQKMIRAMWLFYDHWSDKCRTYECLPLPDYHALTLHELFLSQFELKVEIMNYREKEEMTVKHRVAALPPEPSLSQEIVAWNSEPQRALSEEIMFRETEEEDKLGRAVIENLNEFEVNLRGRTFLGSLLLLEIFSQPPQAQCFRLKHCVTLRKFPPTLTPVQYYVKFPPPPVEETLPQASEEQDLRITRSVRASNMKMNLEDEKRKLITLWLKPDPTVLWFEQPQVANWDPVHGYWSTEDVHDLDYDEEEETITFRSGRLGLFGLHVNRYCNVPYEDWQFERNEEGGVNFFLKTQKTELLFRIKPGQVCLESIESPPSDAMDWILGKYYSPYDLMQNMKKGGIDVFPGIDAWMYMEDIESKHIVIEKNLYQVWSIFSRTYRFKRSRFNQTAGRANIVFQAQEIYKDHQVDFCLIQAAMCSCYVLDINEEAEAYSSERTAYPEGCIDLYTLLWKNSTENAKREANATCTLLIQTTTEFLSYVRPISFS